METQTKRAKLTPEQLKENMRKSKANWRQNNKDYYRRGGHGYEYMAQKITCECGRTTTYNRRRDHLKSKIHEKRLQAVQAVQTLE